MESSFKGDDNHDYARLSMDSKLASILKERK